MPLLITICAGIVVLLVFIWFAATLSDIKIATENTEAKLQEIIDIISKPLTNDR